MNYIDPFKAVDDRNEEALHAFLKSGGDPAMINNADVSLINYSMNKSYIEGTLLMCFYKTFRFNLACTIEHKKLDFSYAFLLCVADPSYFGEDTQSSLLYEAVSKRGVDKVAMLLALGANPSLRVDGRLPMDAVSSSQDIVTLFIVELLKNHNDLGTPFESNKEIDQDDEKMKVIDKTDQQIFDLKLKKLRLQIDCELDKEKTVIKEIGELKCQLVETRKQITELQERFDSDFANLKAKLDAARQCRDTVFALQKQKFMLSSSDKVNKDLDNEERDLECPICFEVPLPGSPMYQCEEGHLYCGKCKDKPNMDKCPQCKKSIKNKNIRCRVIEKTIKRKYPF